MKKGKYIDYLITDETPLYFPCPDCTDEALCDNCGEEAECKKLEVRP